MRAGYHGDTFGAMGICDPDNGLHQLFCGVLPQHYFVKSRAKTHVAACERLA
jgi:adenosylmethionine-8-amino-7-oxononanoate aminotransferase